MNPWPYVRHRPPIIQREFRGENRLDPLSISPEYATETRNFTSADYPALTVRPGYSVIGEITGSKVLGMGVWKDKELHAVFADGTWRRWTGSGWSSPLATGLDTAAMWSFTNVKANLSDINLVGTNGKNGVRAYNGSTVSSIGNPVEGLDFIEQYYDRLWAAVKNTMHATAGSSADKWQTFNGDDEDSYFKELDTPDGETITAVKAGIGHVTIFKQTSMHELFGAMVSTFRFQPVTFDIGALNNRSVITINGIMYILDRNGIYEYMGGAVPSKKFSTPVQWYVDNLNPAARDTCSLGTDGKKLYVSLPVGNSTLPNTILEYDPSKNTWYTWKDIQPTCFASMAGILYIGDHSGRVLKLEGTADGTAPVTSVWISKAFTAQSMSQTVRWLRAWITAKIPAGSTMNVYISKQVTGDDDWALIQNIPATGWISSKPIYIKSSVAVNARYIRLKIECTGPVTIHEIAREEDYLPLR
ncbi:hypothetical protein [Paenibacillus chitinolyticus]|uniref:hypothetical protein n=1 Tax=Paenibacillus chitinolyticus TaxID=79263 RepID=UPI00366E61E1